MTIKNGADVQIGDDTFQIDKSIGNPQSLYQPHYNHIFENLQAEKADITGMPGKESFRNSDLFWAYDDWSGGEGLAVYDPNFPSMYEYAGALNPRNRGRITGRPNRTEHDLTVHDNGDRPVVTVGAAKVWIAGSRNVFTTENGTSFHTVSDADAGFDTGLLFETSDWRVTAACGAPDGLYVAGYYTGHRGIWKITYNIGDDTYSGAAVLTDQTGKPPFAGLAMMGGRLYGWTGSKLYEIDISGSFPVDDTDSTVYNKVHDTGIDPPDTNVFTAHWWADIVASENSVVYFYTVNGVSHVYDYKYRDSVGAPGTFWTGPIGFSVKSMAYENGVIYAHGHWGGSADAKGQGATYKIPLTTLAPAFAGWYRKNQNQNLQMQETGNSYGSQVLVTAANTGRIFVYDAEFNSITLLDDLNRASGADPDGLSFQDNDHRVGGVATYGPYRFAVVYRPGASGTTYQVVAYGEDLDSERETHFNTSDYTGLNPWFQTPWWDFNFPFESKTLTGFFLRFQPLTVNENIKVYYSFDDDGSFTLLQNVAYADTNGKSHYFVKVPVNTPLTFTNMKFRVHLTNDVGQPPILYSITAFAALTRKRERWQIVVRVKDELSRTRPSDRRWSGPKIRDVLLDMVDTGENVTFHDGYRYHTPGEYTTHTVKILEAQDIIQESGEGSMKLTLEAIPDDD
jgi:hypothetical protein